VIQTRNQVTYEDIRSFTLEQFERIKESNNIKKLVHFHNINKYLFMIFDQNESRILGNVVANKDKKSFDVILSDYEIHLKLTLSKPITITSITNVLNKIYSHFKKKFTSKEKKLFLKIIEDYLQCKISLGHVLNHMDKFIQKYQNGYLERQSFYLLYSDVEDTSFFKSFKNW
jgi:uncharacterized protein YbgA (DUF1722 family)